MVYLGVMGVFLLALYVTRAFSLYLKRADFEKKQYIKLLEHIKDRIFCYLEPIDSAILSFDGSNSSVELLKKQIEMGKSPKSAFLCVKSKLLLSKEFTALLENAFFGLGDSEREKEAERLEYLISRLLQCDEKEKAEEKNKFKIAVSLIFALSVGICILII